jgi:D-amino peptidase
MMKRGLPKLQIYILADMEGISGISMLEQCRRSTEEYPGGCKYLMDEINVAVDAAFAAGATDVVVCDTHGGGGHLDLDMMDSRAQYERPKRPLMMPSLTEDFAGVILLGHHAMAGTPNGFLDHTINGRVWSEFRINDEAVGEIGMEAAYAGHYDVPIIVVTGDETTAIEAKARLGAVECAVVKTGTGRLTVESLPIDQAHAVVRTAITTAIHNIDRYTPSKPALPAALQLTVKESAMADRIADAPNIERVDATTLRAQISEFKDIRIF